MSDGFDPMTATSRSFFAQLAQNNRKGWFDTRKSTFKDGIEAPARRLADLLAEDLSRITGQSRKGEVGRIHSATPFSADKTPCITRLHTHWESANAAPGWLFRGMANGPGILTGPHGMDSAAPTRFRAAVDRDRHAPDAAITDARGSGAERVNMGPEPLKRVPGPHVPDHPHEAPLRRKTLAPRRPDPRERPIASSRP